MLEILAQATTCGYIFIFNTSKGDEESVCACISVINIVINYKYGSLL